MILFSLSCFTVFSIRLLSVCNYGREGLGDPITCDDVRQHQVECSHTASDVATLQFCVSPVHPNRFSVVSSNIYPQQ